MPPSRFSLATLGVGLALCAALSVGLLGACRGPAAPAGGRPPDVLLLVVDTLRADRLGSHGYDKPTSPRLDALAAEGVRFANAVAPSTWTKPSMAALFTGRYPSELGLAGEETTELEKTTAVLPESVELLAERFARGGYRTLAVLNQIHLDPRWGFARGFEQYRRLDHFDAFALNDELRGLLAADDGRPVFAWLHYFDVHWPYVREVRGLPEDLFGPRDLGALSPRISMHEIVAQMTARPDRELAARLSNRYDAEIRYADEAAGAMLDFLARTGRLDNTIVVVTADHGEQFLEHGEFGHGNLPYDEEARIPLIVRTPERFGFTPGVRRQPANLLDVGPTLLELAGLEADPTARGRSLVAALGGTDAPGGAVLTQTDRAWAARGARHKLIRFTAGRQEFYELASDPGELDDRAAAGCTGPCAALADFLTQLAGRLETGGGTSSGVELTAEETEQLRSLGYL